MFRGMKYSFICLLLAVINHAFAVKEQETLSLNNTNSHNEPALPQSDSVGPSKSTLEDRGNNGASASTKKPTEINPRRLIVRFPNRAKPVPFDYTNFDNQGKADNNNMGIVVRNLKYLKTYIIEMGEGNSLDEVKRLSEFLISEGGTVEKDAIATLNGIGGVATTSTDDSYKRELPNPDPPRVNSTKPQFSPEQRYIEVLHVDEAWHQMKKLAKQVVKVCIIDTGVDYEHPALDAVLDINDIELKGRKGKDDDHNGVLDDVYGANFVENNGNPMDTNGHGTNVAGIIAAKYKHPNSIAGINPQARLVSCKAFNSKQGYVADILQCIDYCMARRTSVQNHSWTLNAESDALKAAFAVAEKRNVLMVVSAGNVYKDTSKRRNIDKNVVIPAIYSKFFSNVLTVSGMQVTEKNTSMERYEQCKLTKDPSLCQPGKALQVELYSRSQYGPSFSHLVAPAHNIQTIGINNGLVVVEGVSMATAIMTGVASLLLSINLNRLKLDAVSVGLFIRDATVTVPSLQNKVRWGGYINCRTAVIAIWRYNRALRQQAKEFQSRILSPRWSDKLVLIV